MGVCNCSMMCCTLLCVRSSIAIILMGKRELVALLNLSSWCPVMVEWLFLAVTQGCLRFVIVVFPDHALLLILYAWAFCVNYFFIRYLTIMNFIPTPIKNHFPSWTNRLCKQHYNP